MVMGQTCSLDGKTRRAYSIFVGKSSMYLLLGMLRSRLDDIVNINLAETGCEGGRGV
jgi:hypothetical protein